MFWVILSLLTAAAVAFRDISVKTYQDLDTLEIAGIELFWSLPFFCVGFLLVPTPLTDAVFWQAFLVSIPLNAIPYILYLYALKKSPVSLTVPFLSFTPLFMIMTGYVTLGESITLLGGAGILAVVGGSYVLNMQHVAKGFLEPVKALLHERGSICMLLVSGFYAFASVYGKLAILHSSALYFSYLFFLVLNCILLVILLICNRITIRQVFLHKNKGIWLGALLMSHVSTHCLAMAVSTAVYMIALKRSSILMSIVLSWIILKEGDVVHRGTGALLMFIGLVIITVWG